MNITETLMEIYTLAFLAACAFQDVKTHRISIITLGLAGAAAVFGNLLFSELSLIEMLLGTIPGVLLLLISAASSQNIGAGDALMLIAAGMFLGLYRCTELLIMSLLICAAVSAFLMVFKVKRWKDSMAFAPYMLAGFVSLEVMNL